MTRGFREKDPPLRRAEERQATECQVTGDALRKGGAACGARSRGSPTLDGTLLLKQESRQAVYSIGKEGKVASRESREISVEPRKADAASVIVTWEGHMRETGTALNNMLN